MRTARVCAELGLIQAETAHAVAPKAASFDAHAPTSQVEGTTLCIDATLKAFGNVIVQSARNQPKEPGGDGDRASKPQSIRYDYLVL
jgi:hypothetical protein